MSYDLMVFDRASAPANPDHFRAWYHAQTEYTESHGYDDPIVTSPELRAWFLDMIERFPAMNGPYAPEDDDDIDSNWSDYSVGRSFIYVGFAWSVAEEAQHLVTRLAQEHGLGFYDPQSDASGIIETARPLVHEVPRQWWAFWK